MLTSRFNIVGVVFFFSDCLHGLDVCVFWLAFWFVVQTKLQQVRSQYFYLHTKLLQYFFLHLNVLGRKECKVSDLQWCYFLEVWSRGSTKKNVKVETQVSFRTFQRHILISKQCHMCHVHAEAEEFAHVFIFETGSVRPAWMIGCWESQRQDFVFGLVQRRFMLSDVRLGPTDFTALRVYTYISVIYILQCFCKWIKL